MEQQAKRSDTRLLSAVELMLAAGLVLGHNVCRILPNEVPILTVAALVSVRLREGGWAALGFRRPKSWIRIVLIAVAAAVLRLVVSDPIEAALTPLWGAPATSSVVTAGPHDVRWLIATLTLVWTFAAVGEEIGYRGYVT